MSVLLKGFYHLTKKQFLILMMGGYFCAGFGYMITVTFIVMIIKRQPELQGQGWLVFLVVGLAAAPALSGQIAELSGSYDNALILLAIIVFIGALIINYLRSHFKEL
jgi:hypothetical protein